MDSTIATLLTPAAILALVTIARDLGLPAKLAPVVAIAFGIVIAVVTSEFGHLPIVQYAAGGVLIGLSASGAYDGARLISGNAGKPEGDEIGRAYVSIQPVNDPRPDDPGLAPPGVAG